MRDRRGNMRNVGVLIAVVAMVGTMMLAAPVATSAAEQDDRADQLQRSTEKSKVSSLLQRELAAPTELFMEDEGEVLTVEVTSGLSEEAFTAAVAPYGGLVTGTGEGRYWVTMRSTRVEDLAGLEAVSHLTVPARFYETANVSEGVDVMSVPTWRNAGLTGDGVKVAVVDSGFEKYINRQSTGNLPATVTTKNYCDNGFKGSAHGTATAEIVYDTAPDADMYLVCIDDTADLQKAVTYLINNDIDVVNFSLGVYNNSRGDGSGDLLTAAGQAGRAVDAGITWVASAGNAGQRHWKGTFANDGSGFHEFAPGDKTNNVVVAPFASIVVFLKWDDWPATSLDYDLRLKEGGVTVESSLGIQSGSEPPTEALVYTNFSTSAVSYGIEIEKYAGTGKPRMDLFITTSTPEYKVVAGSILEPASHPDVVAVGATCWADDVIEPYSSRGPNIAGVKKPDVSAPDGVTTTMYGTANSTCTSGFTGTSAASPHAAGVAALIKEAHPNLAPAGVADRLATHTVDRGPTGLDNTYGAGRIKTFDLCKGSVPTIVGSNAAETITGTASRDIISALKGGDTIDGKGGNDLLCGGDGPDVIRGGSGADTMVGGAGNDVLRGGGGNDSYIGNAGIDTATFSWAQWKVTANLTTGIATGEGKDTIATIENLIGTAKNDTLTGNSEVNDIRGREGGDTIDGKGGDDLLFGDAGIDTIYGRSGKDLIEGGSQPDDLFGGGGGDDISGGAGDDLLDGGDGSDTLAGNGGVDECLNGEIVSTCELP